MKDIPGYEGLYGITSCGRVWSYRRKKFLKQREDRYGYLRVSLSKNGEAKTLRVHRLVAITYIPNPENLETVDHIDNCKTHNWLSNLHWMSNSGNIAKGNRNRKKIELKR